MGLTVKQLHPLEYHKWHLLFMLTAKGQSVGLTDKEAGIQKALELDTDVNEFWGHVLWLLEKYSDNQAVAIAALKDLGDTALNDWAESIIQIAHNRRLSEVGMAPHKLEEGKPLTWD